MPARTFFGHPRGLATLFFSEMWERFSYYGMRGFLILYMVAPAAEGGMGLPVATASVVYGTYTSLVYLTTLAGGWAADRLIGQRRAVLVGGILIACGHYSLAVPAPVTFYTGLVLIVLGTGLLKPNISVIVGQLYDAHDVRRDAAFSIFYMGINVGGFFGPIVTGFLAQSPVFRAWLVGWGLDPNAAWHWGFAAAGVGMTLGLVQFVAGRRLLGDAGRSPVRPAGQPAITRGAAIGMGGGVIALAVLGLAIAMGAIPATPDGLAAAYGYTLLLVTAGFFGWLFFGATWTRAERRRLYVIGVFFVAAALFWSVSEQAGSTLNLFADRSTRNVVFGYRFPSSWWQSLNPLVIFALAPALAWLWVKLGRRQPASPAKFALGLVAVGAGLLLLAPAGAIVATGAQVGLSWLFFSYLIQTIGELLLSPVGLSAMSTLAPARIVSLVMGLWFLASSVGNFLSGQAASFYDPAHLVRIFVTMSILPIAAGTAMWIFRRPLAAMTGE